MNIMMGHPRYYCLAWLFERDMSDKKWRILEMKMLRSLRSIMEDGQLSAVSSSTVYHSASQIV